MSFTAFIMAEMNCIYKNGVIRVISNSEDNQLEEAIGTLLITQGLSLSLAESCTGGMIAARVTDIPGSSAYFFGGVVAYDNRVKRDILAVTDEDLAKFGAVSREVAWLMASGVKKLLKTDIGLAVTGIAGPGGGTIEKPVGLVYVSLDAGESVFRELHLDGNRLAIRTATVGVALEMLWQYLIAREMRI